MILLLGFFLGLLATVCFAWEDVVGRSGWRWQVTVWLRAFFVGVLVYTIFSTLTAMAYAPDRVLENAFCAASSYFSALYINPLGVNDDDPID